MLGQRMRSGRLVDGDGVEEYTRVYPSLDETAVRSCSIVGESSIPCEPGT